MYLKFDFVIFSKRIMIKAAQKILLKLTIGVNLNNILVQL